jgi:hypothetical protein
VFSWSGVIFEIPRLLKIWKDPKVDNTMYMKDILKDWTSPHLLDCGWYIDYRKENIPPSKFKIWEKPKLRFLQGFETLEKEKPRKKILEGGKRRGKRQI